MGTAGLGKPTQCRCDRQIIELFLRHVPLYRLAIVRAKDSHRVTLDIQGREREGRFYGNLLSARSSGRRGIHRRR
jgi:hypothetical protein